MSLSIACLILTASITTGTSSTIGEQHTIELQENQVFCLKKDMSEREYEFPTLAEATPVLKSQIYTYEVYENLLEGRLRTLARIAAKTSLLDSSSEYHFADYKNAKSLFYYITTPMNSWTNELSLYSLPTPESLTEYSFIYEGGGSSGGSSSSSSEPVAQRELTPEVSFNARDDESFFFGANFNKDACMFVVNVIDTITNVADYSEDIALLATIFSSTAIGMSLAAFIAQVQSLVSTAFLKLFVKLVIANLLEPMLVILAIFAALAGIVIIAMYWCGLQEKGFRAGWSIKNGGNWEWQFGYTDW